MLCALHYATAAALQQPRERCKRVVHASYCALTDSVLIYSS